MTGKLYLARSPEVAARRLGDEVMIMSGKDSTLYTLNEVAAILWEAADGSTTLEEIVESRICAQFEINPAEALEDARALADELAGYGILVLSNEPMTPPAATSAGAGAK